jgi:hypothetical protein
MHNKGASHMPKFRVKGCFKENAEDVEIIIEAASYKDAERIANQKGILVSDVLTFEEQSQKQHETSVLPTTPPESKKKSKVKTIVIISIAAIFLFSCMLSTLIPAIGRATSDSKGSNRSTQKISNVSNRVPNTQPKKWYEGGTLHKSTVTEWRRASVENKVATCGDFAASVDDSVSMELLKQRVLQLVLCIDEAVADVGVAEKLDLSTAEVAAMCVTLLQNEEGNSTW